MRRTCLGLVVGVTLACGPKAGSQAVVVDEGFECNDRRIAYELVGGFGAHKTGVAATCSAGGPRVTLFRQESPDAERTVKHKSIGSSDFDKLWEAIDSTGWRQLTDCDYIGLDDDPRYTIMIGDHAAASKVGCSPEGSSANKKLQFPHSSIVNELDRAAGGLR